MEKRILILLTLLTVLLLSSFAAADNSWICENCSQRIPNDLGDICPYCGEHHHQWTPATCTEPEKCSCGKTKGEPAGHDWLEATCTEPKTCKNCGATEGSAKGHDWLEATCTEPKTCKNCGATEGSAKGHDWLEATCTEPKTCKNCGATEGGAKGHDWQEATCIEPKKCKVCGIIEGNTKGHDWIEATCTEPKKCKVCGVTEGTAKGHDWLDATCTKPKTCKACGATEGKAKGHSWDNGSVYHAATCTATGIRRYTCRTCGETKDETIPVDPNNHAGGTDVRNKKEATGGAGYTGDIYCKGCNKLIKKGSSTLAVGTTVTFGKYEQDNNTANGPEKIEWIVLDVKEDKCLLMSRYGLETMAFNQSGDATWERCTLRKWLNNEFYNSAFTRQEQSAIQTTSIVRVKKYDYEDDAINTQDKVFLMDRSDVDSFIYQFAVNHINAEVNYCRASDYALAHGAFTGNSVSPGDGRHGLWWLRNTDRSGKFATFVDSRETRSYSGWSVTRDDILVRPALWMDFD